MQIEKLNRSEAFRYMSTGEGSEGKIKGELLKITEECEQMLLKVIEPRFIYKIFDIKVCENKVNVLNTSLTLKGKDISDHLKGCSRCVLLCVTLSAGVDKLIRTYETEGMEKALVADSLASAAVEQACELAEKEIRSAVGNYGYTWRFSPGYGDFPLDIQEELLKVIDAPKRIGVNVTDSLILIPRKSVTAVIGVSENEVPKGRRGCGSCNMKDRCQYRKNYAHCG